MKIQTKIEKKKIEDICKILSHVKSDLILLVIDKKVEKIYGKKILISGKKVLKWVAPEGEECKNFSNYEKCTRFFLKKKIHREAHLVAIGGGATSDLAGYVASTLLRGISWSVVPTTLLAMVDASIGGKTGINVENIKNQLGTFYAPQNIWLDFSFLETLSAQQIQSGKGEVLKYTFLSSAIAKMLKEKGFCPELIMACANYKRKLVESDFFETKRKRIKLNLGHTLGHAFEQCLGLPHGIAVSYGIGAILRLFDLKREYELWEKRSLQLGIETQEQLLGKKEMRKIIKIIMFDKKKTSSQKIELILPRKKKILIKEIRMNDFKEKILKMYGY